MLRDLRSDHAGEVGAVMIYEGILAFARSSEVREFAQSHLLTEREHLAFFEATLPANAQTRAIPLWRLAGWLTGALPALIGPKAVYATVAAVEEFVDGHYRDQIKKIESDRRLEPLAEALSRFRDDERAHRDDARTRRAAPPTALEEAWRWLVGIGSAAGVALARRI